MPSPLAPSVSPTPPSNGFGHEFDYGHDIDHDRDQDRRDGAPSARSDTRSTRPATIPPPSTVHYEPTLTLTGHSRPVTAVKFSPDGKLVASASADAAIVISDAYTGRHIHTLEGHLAGISTISWSPNSRHLASGSDDKTIRLWDAVTGTPHPVPFEGHHNYVFSIAFSPKGNMLVSGSYDEAVFIWDVRSATVIRSLPAHSDPVGGVNFVFDGTLIASCSSDGLIRLWDAVTGQCLRTIVHENNAGVTAVKFSPNGKYILAWTLDSSIRLWDYVSGRCIKTYQGHANTKFGISGAFGVYGWGSASSRDDPNGLNNTPVKSTDSTATTPPKNLATANTTFDPPYSFIVSGSEDGALFFWDVVSKRVLQHIPDAHQGTLFAVDCHPSESMIVTGGTDGVVRLWRDTHTPSLPVTTSTSAPPDRSADHRRHPSNTGTLSHPPPDGRT